MAPVPVENNAHRPHNLASVATEFPLGGPMPARKRRTAKGARDSAAIGGFTCKNCRKSRSQRRFGEQATALDDRRVNSSFGRDLAKGDSTQHVSPRAGAC